MQSDGTLSDETVNGSELDAALQSPELRNYSIGAVTRTNASGWMNAYTQLNFLNRAASCAT